MYLTLKDKSRIFYKSPKNPKIILIHGLACDHTIWDKYNINALRLDLRGHGKSSKKGKLTIEELTNDLEQLIKKLKINPTIVGHSIGALVTLRYKEKYPKTKIILIAPVINYKDLNKILVLENKVAQIMPRFIYKLISPNKFSKNKVLFSIKCMALTPYKSINKIIKNLKTTKIKPQKVSTIIFKRDGVVNNNITKYNSKIIKLKGTHLSGFFKKEAIKTIKNIIQKNQV